MNSYELKLAIGEPEYDRGFQNYIRGKLSTKATKEFHYDSSLPLSASSGSLFEKYIKKESIFRNIATLINNYDGADHLLVYNCDDIVQFVSEDGAIDTKDMDDDFSSVSIGRYKLASMLRVPIEFVSDATFDFEAYLLKRLAKNYGRAEDKAFIIGTGTDEPTGILHDTAGADIGITTETLSFDDVVSLYFSVEPRYRKNAVWLMNDATAMTLRKLKDENGNYLWNTTTDTIFGKPVLISEYMPDADTGDKPIAFGDFSFYWFIRRSPLTVKVLKEKYLLTGQYGYLTKEFIDGKLICSEAVKVLKIADNTAGG